ncbi:CDP-glycerol glycerophosphotransferase family protein [Halalkalibacillus halophilus]|uniref:CDP-glycerol glycerophosphotransferase family protein n=1 Tax=Halalkalibacillus halophilus TaxID=392827 RepID=UPI000411CF4B|nr:CDP-glycerol glycerophosphotransferase family protein [Halalkalibacillus halophilus]
MNTYIKNYWSLYLEFILDFQKVTYRGLSLSYLIHFPSLIRKRPEVWNAFHQDAFAERLARQITDQKEFQQIFTQYFQSHKQSPSAKKAEGKVIVIGDRLIRLPDQTYQDYFPPSNTVIVKTSNKEKSIITPTRIPNKYISEYQINIKKQKIIIQNQLRQILKAYKGHHLYGKEYFQKLLLRKAADVANQIEISNRMLDDVTASCIIISSPNHFSRVVALVAAERGIPTICIQHGIVANEFGYLPKIATVDPVYGQYEVDWYKKMGAPVESLEIIGHPRFDQLFENKIPNKQNMYKKLGLNTKKKTLMVIVRGNRHIEKWKILLDTISKSKELDMNILIKDFPSNPSHELVKRYPFAQSTKNEELYDLLPIVDGVISYTSTVGLEAMLIHKPVFIMHTRLPSYTGYFDALGEAVQKDPQRLAVQIINYFNDESWKKSIDNAREEFLKYAYPNVGSSGNRLQELVNRLSK